MFKKALIAIDLSPAERPLINCLPELKRWGIGSLVLAHVIRVGYIEGAEYGHGRSWLDERAAPLREAGFTVSVSITDSGAPAEELLAVAAGKGVDLIVVGSRSHSFAHDLFLGSVASDLIRGSMIPVMIERIEPTEAGTAETCAAACDQKLDRILLATDLSSRSRLAEEAAVFLASKAAETNVLTVLPEGVAPKSEDISAKQQKLDALAHRIEARGGRGRAWIEHGRPADVIARVGQEGYTLIIVGKHGRNWIDGMIIGSTAAKVCGIAKRPVLIVP